jgi:metallophosphoesterase superfamily enzyme
MSISTVAFDVHRPYHNQRAWELFLQVSKDIKTEELIIGGDFLDMVNVARYTRKLELTETFQDEIEDGLSELALIKAEFPNTKKVYLFGNHEIRLEDYISKKCGEFAGYMDLKKLLCLGALGFEYVPYDPHQCYISQGWMVCHEVTGPITTAAANCGGNVIFGHNHRLASVCRTVKKNEQIYTAINGGWLGDKMSPAFHYIKGHQNWQLGFVVIIDGIAMTVPILEVNGKLQCRVEGKLYVN